MIDTLAAVLAGLPLVGSAVYTTWRMGRATALFESSIERQREEGRNQRLKLDQLDCLPVMQNDIGNLQIQVQRMNSAFPEMKNKLAVLETRVLHLEDYRPRTRSTTNEE